MHPLSVIKIGFGVLVAALVASFALGSFYTVDEGERAVVLRNGAVKGTAEPGLHWKLPFGIDTIKTISVQTQALEFPEEPVYSADRQTANVTFSINYSALPDEVQHIYTRFGSLNGIETREIARQARQQVKNVFGRFTAETAIRERGRLNTELYNAIVDVGDGLIRVESLQVENIDFSKAVEDAAEDRAKAEMLVQTKKQELERTRVEAQITVTQAQATADSRLAEAKAAAEATKLAGDAEAAAIRAKGEALRDNPKLIELIAVQTWSGVLPTTMVPGGAVPFVDVSPKP